MPQPTWAASFALPNAAGRRSVPQRRRCPRRLSLPLINPSRNPPTKSEKRVLPVPKKSRLSLENADTRYVRTLHCSCGWHRTARKAVAERSFLEPPPLQLPRVSAILRASFLERTRFVCGAFHGRVAPAQAALGALFGMAGRSGMPEAVGTAREANDPPEHFPGIAKDGEHHVARHGPERFYTSHGVKRLLFFQEKSDDFIAREVIGIGGSFE